MTQKHPSYGRRPTSGWSTSSLVVVSSWWAPGQPARKFGHVDPEGPDHLRLSNQKALRRQFKRAQRQIANRPENCSIRWAAVGRAAWIKKELKDLG